MAISLQPFVTRWSRECVAAFSRDTAVDLEMGGRSEHWIFVWRDLDRLFAHLQELVHDPESGFGLRAARRVMATARRQIGVRELRPATLRRW